MPKGGVANRAIKALNVLPGQHKLGKGKRFKFLTFQDLINRVDVSRDVYRDTTTKLQLAPADGAESFFQQYLAEWSELDLTADFKTFANEVYPLSQSLAQLLHYRHFFAYRRAEVPSAVHSIAQELQSLPPIGEKLEAKA